MRAAVCYEREAPLRVEDVEPLPPRACDVVVRVTACGICHSDLSVITGVYALPLPALLGHEVAGVVDQVGPHVTRTRAGQRVLLASGPVCGACARCADGEPHLCRLNWEVSAVPRVRLPDGRSAHAIAGLGGFGELVTVHEASVVPIESSLPDEELAIIGCGVGVGAGAVMNTARVRPGESVAVMGCGGVGLAAVAAARISGAARIIAVDPKGGKLDAALRHGATDVIDPRGEDVVARVQELTGGGVDHSFEAVGLGATIVEAYRMARQGGRAIVVGFAGPDQRIELSAEEFFMGGRELRPSLGCGGDSRQFYPRLVRLAEAGRLDLAAFVSGRHELERVNDALENVRGGDSIREVISFRGAA